ncbi:MAG: potassium channel protein [Candidatus Cloacimonetes bacterium]|nr:potassium channel protein [Candidatus Cloacimonadota bacterium]
MKLWTKLINKWLEQTVLISAENRLLMKRVFFIGCFVLILVLLSSFLAWRFEYKGQNPGTISTFWDGIWWAIVTIATVGYGDKVPTTVPGRGVGLFMIIIGYAMLSVFTGLVASVFVEDKLKGAKGLKPIRASHHLILCGWNQTAGILLQALTEKSLNDMVVGIVSNQPVEFFDELESRYPSLQLRFVRGEPTQEDVLRRAAVNNASHVIILADESLSPQSADDRSIIIANAVHFISRKVPVTVQLMNGNNKNLLYRIGIESIIVYDEWGGYLLSNTVLEQNYLELYEHLVKESEQKMNIVKIPENLICKTYGDVFDYFYNEKKQVLLGLFNKESELDLNDIFNDNSSAIDQFIKSALTKSKKQIHDKKTNVKWNPKRETIIENSDMAIVMS